MNCSTNQVEVSYPQLEFLPRIPWKKSFSLELEERLAGRLLQGKAIPSREEDIELNDFSDVTRMTKAPIYSM